jgi:hypothetical protein
MTLRVVSGEGADYRGLPSAILVFDAAPQALDENVVSPILIRWAQRARCQAETPLIALFRFPRPALSTSGHCSDFVVWVYDDRSHKLPHNSGGRPLKRPYACHCVLTSAH